MVVNVEGNMNPFSPKGISN